MSFTPEITLAESITRKASKQTYYTIRFLVDRGRTRNAYRAYAYFRWVDDILDGESIKGTERGAFLQRQKSLMESCYRGENPRAACIQEQMLVDLIHSDHEPNSGLQKYIRNLMAVMTFDMKRRSRLISESELSNYSRLLAIAVTEAMHYFIGHECPAPCNETRYLAVTAAHITHMLRDTFDDNRAGYYNIPREILQAHSLTPFDLQKDSYRNWVKSRVQLARAHFAAGKNFLLRVGSLRCRMACLAYTARFEQVLNSIERDDFLLRPTYAECKSLKAGADMMWSSLSALLSAHPRAELASEQ